MRTLEESCEDDSIGSSRETSGRTVAEADIVLRAGQTATFPHHVDAEWCAMRWFEHRPRRE